MTRIVNSVTIPADGRLPQPNEYAAAIEAAEAAYRQRAGGRPLCPTCHGCGQIANDDDRTPWFCWELLPELSRLAVRLGLVRPRACPACCGSGLAVTGDDLPASWQP